MLKNQNKGIMFPQASGIEEAINNGMNGFSYEGKRVYIEKSKDSIYVRVLSNSMVAMSMPFYENKYQLDELEKMAKDLDEYFNKSKN